MEAAWCSDLDTFTLWRLGRAWWKSCIYEAEKRIDLRAWLVWTIHGPTYLRKYLSRSVHHVLVGT